MLSDIFDWMLPYLLQWFLQKKNFCLFKMIKVKYLVSIWSVVHAIFLKIMCLTISEIGKVIATREKKTIIEFHVK